jgi:hypothetical protein
MKLCKYCGIERDEAEFEIALTKGDKVYRRLKCAVCKNVQQRDRVRRTRKWVQDLRKTLCCERCGFSDWRALDFHHRDPQQKSLEVANLVRGNSLDIIKAEIAKCSVLCANCHRITHFEEREAQFGT